MSDVQFDEQAAPAASFGPDRPSALVSLAMRAGLGKDAASAEKALVILAVIALVAAALLFMNSSPEVIPAPEPALTFLS